jgi:hypothetical protein
MAFPYILSENTLKQHPASIVKRYLASAFHPAMTHSLFPHSAYMTSVSLLILNMMNIGSLFFTLKALSPPQSATHFFLKK